MMRGILSLALAAIAQLTPQMHEGIPDARYIPAYNNEQRVLTVQKLLHPAKEPKLGTVPLTPNAPLAADGAHLSFWKTSFVLGTPAGGEAGVNFWGIHTGGHINVGFTASGRAAVLDCRVLGRVMHKLYAGADSEPREQAETPLADGHMLLVLPALARGMPVSVELWPVPADATMGFIGCEIDTPVETDG
jgi:hypothetical protein